MDDATEKRLDAVVEDEVRRGYRIKALPKALIETLAEEGVTLERVRFTRINPARRRKIAEVVQRQYHKDLRNSDVLSHEQIMKLVTERGEWSEQHSADMKAMQESVNRRMGLLLFGTQTNDIIQELWKAADGVRELITEKVAQERQDEVRAVFDRWVDYTPDAKAQYTADYAEGQGRSEYSPDLDLQKLYLALPGATARQKLDDLEATRDRVYDLILLQRDRVKLMDLQVKHAKIFADSAEQRRDNAEEMARMYFCAERVDEAGKPQGPLMAEFDKLYDLPEDAIQWLLVESYFFQNGIPDEAREYLETVGFLPAERGSNDKASPNSESAASAESPVPQSSSPATAAAEPTPVASSAWSAATTSTTDSLPS